MEPKPSEILANNTSSHSNITEVQLTPADISIIRLQPSLGSPLLFTPEGRKSFEDPEMLTLKEIMTILHGSIPDDFEFNSFDCYGDHWMEGSLGGFDVTMDKRPIKVLPFRDDEVCGFLTALIGLGKQIPKNFLFREGSYDVVEVMAKAGVLAYQVTYSEYLRELKERGDVKMLVYFILYSMVEYRYCCYVEAKRGEEAMFYYPSCPTPYKVNLPDVGGVIKAIWRFGEYEVNVSEFWILEAAEESK